MGFACLAQLTGPSTIQKKARFSRLRQGFGGRREIRASVGVEPPLLRFATDFVRRSGLCPTKSESIAGLMANKSIVMSKSRRLLQLHNEGKSKLFISNYLDLSRNTVDKYLTILKIIGKPIEDLLLLKDQ